MALTCWRYKLGLMLMQKSLYPLSRPFKLQCDILIYIHLVKSNTFFFIILLFSHNIFYYVFPFSQILPAVDHSLTSSYIISFNELKCYFILVLIYIIPMIGDVEIFFLSLMAIFIPLKKYSSRCFLFILESHYLFTYHLVVLILNDLGYQFNQMFGLQIYLCSSIHQLNWHLCMFFFFLYCVEACGLN